MGDEPITPFDTALQRVEFRPGDRFVLRLDTNPSFEVMEHLLHAWRSFAGPDVPLLVLPAGMRLDVIGQEAFEQVGDDGDGSEA